MQVNEKLREVEEGKESAEAMWLQTRHNLGNNEDELMEARAQVDLYKIQINEKDAENQSLRVIEYSFLYKSFLFFYSPPIL